MKKKAVSGMILLLLLTSMLSSVFIIQPVKASGTIYIRADGNVEGTDKIRRDGDVYTFTANIYASIVVQRNNIVIDGVGYTLQGTGSGTGIDLSMRTSVTVKNINIKDFDYGILLVFSFGMVVSSNSIANNRRGVSLDSSSYNSISGNNITNNREFGIFINDFSRNSISGNSITNNGRDGIKLVYSSNNNIIGNIIKNNLDGIGLVHSSNNSIIGNNATANTSFDIYLWRSDYNSIIRNRPLGTSIWLGDSSNNIITENIMAHRAIGIHLQNSSDNSIAENSVTNNDNGIVLVESSKNRFHHNDFIDNTKQIISDGSPNVWDDGYPSGGNYWSDYVQRYPYAKELDGSGIWNTPYIIDAYNRDRYPLMKPWTTTLHKFKIGDGVRTTANLNVRAGPGLSYAIISTKPLGTLGQIVGGPVEADGFVWWDVDYVVGVRGWSAENWLELADEPSEELGFLTLPFRDADVKVQQGWIYTWNPDPDAHQGIDYKKGDWESFDVVAAANGRAMWSEQYLPDGSGYGKFVLIWHEEKDPEGNNYFTLYAHLDSIAPGIPYKNRFDTNYLSWKLVERGEVIGRAGNTGAPSVGIHLHFEVQRKAYAHFKTDPYDLNKTREYYPNAWLYPPETSKYTHCGPNHLWTTDPPMRTLNELPIADAGFDKSVSSGDFVLFDGSKSYPDGTIVSYQWDFGDGTMATGKIVSHRFRGAQNESKTYTVTLTVEDNDGAADTDTVHITVYPLTRTIKIFSPLSEFMPIPTPPIIEVTVYYNWVTEMEGQDAYIISKIHLDSMESLGFTVYVFDIEGDGQEIWHRKHVDWGRAEITFAYPFNVPRDSTLTINGEYFKGLEVGPNSNLFFAAMGIELKPEPSGFYVSRRIELGPGRQTEVPSIYPEAKMAGILHAILSSPAELRVYDSQGRVTGLVKGDVKEEIPYSVYDKETESVIVLAPTDSYRYEVAGTNDGTYGLTVTSVTEGNVSTFNATDIPTSVNVIHQYTIDWAALSLGEEGVTVQIDSDGDGVFEHVFTSDSELTQSEFIIAMDTTPPTTTHDYNGLWHTSDFTINLTATDSSNIAETYYKINNEPTKTVNADGQPFIKTEGANNTLEYWSVDKFGNEELPHKMLTGIKLDKTAPTLSKTLSGTQGNNNWYTSVIQVTLTGSDSGSSGIASIEHSFNGVTWTVYTGPFIITAQGTTTLYHRVTDNAGNVYVLPSQQIKIDTVASAGSILINGGVAYTTSTSVTLTLTYSDATSGVSQVRYSNDNSSWSAWDSPSTTKAWNLTAGDGTKTVYYQIRDNAGNTATYSASISLQSPSPSPTPSPSQSQSPSPNPSPSPTPSPKPTPKPAPTPSPSPLPEPTPTPTPQPPEEQPLFLYIIAVAVAFAIIGAAAFMIKKRR